jgi:hypothetical protein
MWVNAVMLLTPWVVGEITVVGIWVPGAYESFSSEVMKTAVDPD